MKTLYLSDFDGTITKQDTLDYIAKTYYPRESRLWQEKMKEGVFTVSDWVREFQDIFDIKKSDYIAALNKIEIDTSFRKFITGRTVVVISGGFLFNVEHILAHYGITGIPLFGNVLEFTSENRVSILMDHFNPLCGFCGLCKKNIFKEYRRSYERIVYIGDGISDLCVSKECDTVYVKEGSFLEKKLGEQGYNTTSFALFSQIIEKEKSLV